MNSINFENATTLGGLITAVADAHPEWVSADALGAFAASSWATLPVANIELGACPDAPLLTATVGPVDDWAPENNKTLKLILKEKNDMGEDQGIKMKELEPPTVTEINCRLGLTLEVNNKHVTVVVKQPDPRDPNAAAKASKATQLALPSPIVIGSVDELKTWVTGKLGLGADKSSVFDDLPEPLKDFKAQLENAHLVLEAFELTVPAKVGETRGPVTFAMDVSADWSGAPLEIVGDMKVKKIGFHIDRSVKS